MAYSEALAQRMRPVLHSVPGVTEKKMFGGIAWMLNGNMACGIIGYQMMVRVGPNQHDAALALPHVGVMSMGGRPPSRGIVMVGDGALGDEAEVEAWIRRGLDFAASLPPK